MQIEEPTPCMELLVGDPARVMLGHCILSLHESPSSVHGSKRIPGLAEAEVWSNSSEFI